jgi:hypothetical protein
LRGLSLSRLFFFFFVKKALQVRGLQGLHCSLYGLYPPQNWEIETFSGAAAARSRCYACKSLLRVRKSSAIRQANRKSKAQRRDEMIHAVLRASFPILGTNKKKKKKK